MSNKHLKLEPHYPMGRRNWWWYETRAGMEILYGAEGQAVKYMLIPWSSVRAALKRKDKP